MEAVTAAVQEGISMVGEDYLDVALNPPKLKEPEPLEWYDRPQPWLCRLGIHQKSQWCPDLEKHQISYCLRCLKNYIRVPRHAEKLSNG